MDKAAEATLKEAMLHLEEAKRAFDRMFNNSPKPEHIYISAHIGIAMCNVMEVLESLSKPKES